MSTLIILLPSQPRLATSLAEAPSAGPTPEFEYLLTGAAAEPPRFGRAAAADLPPAKQNVAVVAPADIAWHRLKLPKAPASRMRQALAGLLEESLLEDESDVHLALSGSGKAGESGWVAAVNKMWLSAHLFGLEQAGRDIDRVVPAWSPDGEPAAQVFCDETGLQLAWRDADGPLCVPLESGTARALAKGDTAADISWSACPEGAEAAAALAGAAVEATDRASLLQAAALSPWNLRQFDLAPQRRGQRAARELLHQLMTEPAWRPFRWGLIALLLLQLVGANLWAWQQNRALEQRKVAMNALLQATFPKVRGVIDAPAQMNKEVDLLRAAAGKPGETDLETLLYAAQGAWPAGKGNVDGFQYDTGRLSLNSPDWTPEELAALRSGLRAWGLDAEGGESGPVIHRSQAGKAP